MTDIIREIEDETQQDAVREFVQKNWMALVAGMILALLGIAGYLWWDGEQDRRALRDASVFGLALQAFEDGNPERGFTALAELESASAGYALLSRLEAASRHLDSGDLDQALSKFDAIIDDGSADKQYRELATIYKAMALANVSDFDQAIAVVDTIPRTSLAFAPKAIELKGFFLWDQGKPAEALDAFKVLLEELTNGQYSSTPQPTVDVNNLSGYIEQLEAAQ